MKRFSLLAFLAVSLLSAQFQPPLMPWPASVTVQTGAFPIASDLSISLSGAGASDPRVQAAALRFVARLVRQTGISVQPQIVSSGGSLQIVTENKDHKAPQRLGDPERYSLTVGPASVRLSADGPLGVLRGLETLLQLVHPNQDGPLGFSITAATIQDQPRFPWRGLSLDVSRHFIPVDGIKRTLDGLAAVKLNVFHWHLSDDQGFRVESKKFPRLQQLGSDGLYYGQSEIQDVLAYARERGIRVVPEFDMPGHAASWLPAYPKLGVTKGPFAIVRTHGVLVDLIDPTKESTYKFMDTFVGEMTRLFPDEYFHIGGDEVDPKQWNESPAVQAFARKHHIADAKGLQAYFNARLLKIVTKHGKHMEGWDEILEPDLPKNIVIQSWRGQESLWEAARSGFQGILSAGYYLDLMYSASDHYAVDPLVLPPRAIAKLNKDGKPIPAPLTPEEAKHVLGGEAAMWEQLATSENLDAKLWPRLAAIAERFWSAQSITDVPSMYARLEATNTWLQFAGLTQHSSLALMRERLVGSGDALERLNRFAAVLEPVKGYSRHAQNYSSNTPLNRLVDALPPESNDARNFRNAVEAYLAAPTRDPEPLKMQLQRWSEAARSIRPVLESNSILRENLPAEDALETLCRVGLQALANPGALEPGSAETVKQAAARKGDILIQIAPAIEKLLPTAPQQ